MPEIPARGSDRKKDQPGDTRRVDDPKRSEDSNRETAVRSTAKPNSKAVIPGVRTVSSPPGEPYNDPEYGRS